MNEPDYLDLLADEEAERRDAERAIEDEGAEWDVTIASKLAREPRSMAANRNDKR